MENIGISAIRRNNMKEIYTIYLDNVYNLSASFIMWWLIYGANEINLYIYT